MNKILTVLAPNNSLKTPFVSRAVLNGKPINMGYPRFKQSDMLAEEKNELVLSMSEVPVWVQSIAIQGNV